MSTHFNSTLRSLEGDSPWRALRWVPLALLFLISWFCWFFFSSVPVYLTSQEARLQVEGDGIPIAIEKGGRLSKLFVAAGDEVEAGDILLAMESEAEELLFLEESRRRSGFLEEARRLREVEASARSVARHAATSLGASVERAEAEHKAAQAAFEAAQDEVHRSKRLGQEGLLSARDLVAIKAAAQEREAEALAAARGVVQAKGELARERHEREVALGEIARQIVEVVSLAEASEAKAASLRQEVDKFFIKAPVSGRLIELAVLPPGAVLRPEESLGTLVPSTELRVVARFPLTSSLGRLRTGQTGQLRLDGFPWVEFGTAKVLLEEVAGDQRGGLLRADFLIEKASASSLPLQHGLPGRVMVEVETVSPAALLLRVIGKRRSVPRAARG
ncbi:MAG: HlyD family secretion protein [Deltaproteobacteria bacterium]|nr:HlyD family secretion protein [Deltaproteobacteria bacterium]